MEAHIFLADAAQVVKGKLNALGLGWSSVKTPLPPHAVVILIKVPWGAANMPHKLSITLEDEDGQPVTVSGPAGEQNLHIEGDFEVGRPVGTKPGSQIVMPHAITLGQGLPLPPGSYMWKLAIDGSTEEAWCARFTVRESKD